MRGVSCCLALVRVDRFLTVLTGIDRCSPMVVAGADRYRPVLAGG